MKRFAPLAAAAVLASAALSPALADDQDVATWIDDHQSQLTAALNDKLAAPAEGTDTVTASDEPIQIVQSVITVRAVPVKRLTAASAI